MRGLGRCISVMSILVEGCIPWRMGGARCGCPAVVLVFPKIVIVEREEGEESKILTACGRVERAKVIRRYCHLPCGASLAGPAHRLCPAPNRTSINGPLHCQSATGEGHVIAAGGAGGRSGRQEAGARRQAPGGRLQGFPVRALGGSTCKARWPDWSSPRLSPARSFNPRRRPSPERPGQAAAS